MRVLGFRQSPIWPSARGGASDLSHLDVLAAAEEIKPRLAAVVRGVLATLA